MDHTSCINMQWCSIESASVRLHNSLRSESGGGISRVLERAAAERIGHQGEGAMYEACAPVLFNSRLKSSRRRSMIEQLLQRANCIRFMCSHTFNR